MNNKILKKAAAFFVLVMCLTVITMTGCICVKAVNLENGSGMK